jgi:heavy metal translocating P-type ATPase
LATAKAQVETLQPIDGSVLVDAVQQAGYSARISSNDHHSTDLSERREQESQALKQDLLIAAALSTPVFLLEMGSHLIPAMHHAISQTIGIQNSWYIQFVLSTLVLLFPGRNFYKLGIKSLWHLAPDMNALVAVGTFAAYSFSLVATFIPQLLPAQSVAVYYEAAAVIVTLILLGRYLEAKAKGRTSQAIQRLLGLQAKTARVKRDNGWQEIAIDDVRIDDVIEVLPGAKVAADAIVLSGHSYIDEAMISGEPMAVEKHIGDKLIAGTVNQSGALEARVTATGETTVLAQIIQLVEQAQGGKLAIQTLVDKITLWFVPTVILLALVTFIAWFFFGPEPALSFALVNAVAVLIIACPCAMGLATPTSIMVASGRAAELGVLFRKGEALQQLQQTTVIALDKTGTLTAGKPVLSDLILSTGFSEHQVLSKVAALESKSEHPIARAIVAAAKERNLLLESMTNFESITGFGICAEVSGSLVHVGADRYMQKLGLATEVFAVQAQFLASEGKTPLYAAIDNQLAAVIAVADPIKDSSYAAIKALHTRGLKLVMISGDNTKTAQAIANKLGIDEVIAEVLPDAKVAAVKDLQQQYGCVAYIGDGINDAPALAQADIGIAIGSGTDIAIEAADVVLMSSDLNAALYAIALSQATMRNIKQNLFWAFAYNAALIPVAAGLLYPFNGVLLSPIFAAAAMTLSSIFVLTNALRLKHFNIAQ